jgi:hypothetical protein
MDMRDLIMLVENDVQPVTLYHLTNKAKFKLDPNFTPTDNSISVYGRSGIKGIYLARDVEPWVNGHGYIRPFVAEILADPSALENDAVGRWSGEIFVPSDQFHKLRVTRVIPIDAWCREKYGGHGWIERMSRREFDTGKEILSSAYYQYPFRGYRYDGDVRTLPSAEVNRLKAEFNLGAKAWRRERGM